MQQLGVCQGVLAPDDRHGLGASVTVAVAPGRSHPGGARGQRSEALVTVWTTNPDYG